MERMTARTQPEWIIKAHHVTLLQAELMLDALPCFRTNTSQCSRCTMCDVSKKTIHQMRYKLFQCGSPLCSRDCKWLGKLKMCLVTQLCELYECNYHDNPTRTVPANKITLVMKRYILLLTQEQRLKPARIRKRIMERFQLREEEAPSLTTIQNLVQHHRRKQRMENTTMPSMSSLDPAATAISTAVAPLEPVITSAPTEPNAPTLPVLNTTQPEETAPAPVQAPVLAPAPIQNTATNAVYESLLDQEAREEAYEKHLESFPFHYVVYHSHGDLEQFKETVIYIHDDDHDNQFGEEYTVDVNAETDVWVPTTNVALEMQDQAETRGSETKLRLSAAMFASYLGYPSIVKYLFDHYAVRLPEKKFITMQRAYTNANRKPFS